MQSAGHYQIKIRQICGDVDRKTMHGAPASNPHSDGGEFVFAHPNPTFTFHSLGYDAEIGGRTNENLLQAPHKLAHITLARLHMHNRITDDLAWTLVRDV